MRWLDYHQPHHPSTNHFYPSPIQLLRHHLTDVTVGGECHSTQLNLLDARTNIRIRSDSLQVGSAVMCGFIRTNTEPFPGFWAGLSE